MWKKELEGTWGRDCVSDVCLTSLSVCLSRGRGGSALVLPVPLERCF